MPPLQRYETNLVDPFARIGCCPAQQEIFDRSPDVKILGHNNEPWAGSSVHKFRKVARHSVSIVRDRNSAGLGGYGKDLGIWYTGDTALISVDKIERRFAPSKSHHYFMVEVRVGLETWPHALGVWLRRRASANLVYSSGLFRRASCRIVSNSRRPSFR